MANPSGTHEEGNPRTSLSFAGTVNSSDNPSAETSGSGSGSVSGLMHDPGISIEWTPEEQAILEDGLVRYASESSVTCYAKIALQLQNKTIRDVALRCRWMSKKESGKRRKGDHSVHRRGRDKRERTADMSSESVSVMTNTNNLPVAPSPVPTRYDRTLSLRAFFAGITGEILEQNEQIFNQISGNLSSSKAQDNIALFSQLRINILKLLISLNDAPELMKQMPPLPERLNDGLANTILPPTNLPMLP